MLIAGRLAAHGEKVASALPGEVVVVVESVVGENLRVGIGPDIAGVIADALSGEPHVLLRAKRYADFGVARQAEPAGWVAGHAVVPTHAGKSEASFVDDGGREGVDPARARKLRRVCIVRGEGYRDYG